MIEIKQQAHKVNFTLDSANNAIYLQVLDLEANFKSKKFGFDLTGLWLLPITGYCDVKMTHVQLTVGIKMTT